MNWLDFNEEKPVPSKKDAGMTFSTFLSFYSPELRFDYLNVNT